MRWDAGCQGGGCSNRFTIIAIVSVAASVGARGVGVDWGLEGGRQWGKVRVWKALVNCAEGNRGGVMWGTGFACGGGPMACDLWKSYGGQDHMESVLDQMFWSEEMTWSYHSSPIFVPGGASGLAWGRDQLTWMWQPECGTHISWHHPYPCSLA